MTIKKISSLDHFSSLLQVIHSTSEKARSGGPISQRCVKKFSGIPELAHCKLKRPIRRDHSSMLSSWEAGPCLQKQRVMTRKTNKKTLTNK